MKSQIDELKEKIKLNWKKFNKRLNKLNKKLVTEYRYTDFRCQKCSEYSYLKDVVYIQNFKNGSSVDDYEEYLSSVYLMCPKCGQYHRVYKEESEDLYINDFQDKVYDTIIKNKQYNHGSRIDFYKEGKGIEEINGILLTQREFFNI